MINATSEFSYMLSSDENQEIVVSSPIGVYNLHPTRLQRNDRPLVFCSKN